MKNNKLLKMFLLVFTFLLLLDVKASTDLTYNNSSTKLADYYTKISKGYLFLESNAGLISESEYNKTLLKGTPGSTFLYNGKSFLFSDVNNNLVSRLEVDASIKSVEKNADSLAKLSVLLKKDIEVKGSGTRADPYIFVDSREIIIKSMKKDGVDIDEVPTEGKYDFYSYCIGGIATYSNTTHMLDIETTNTPTICSLEFNKITHAEVLTYIYGATKESNESKILFGANGNVEYSLKNGYINETPYMYCENGTTLAYSNTKITVNNALVDDTCHVVFPKEITADESYVVPVAGTYKIEGWGAQGANYGSTYTGGKGGYISGKTSLSKSDLLVIKIGKQDGTNGGGIGVSGTYNGGGSSRIIKGSTVLLTAAGGGGASQQSDGYAGGNDNGTGGVSVGNGAGVDGTNGGGGSSSKNYSGSYRTYSCNSGDKRSGSTCSGSTSYSISSTAYCSGYSPNTSCAAGYTKTWGCQTCSAEDHLNHAAKSCWGTCTKKYSYAADVSYTPYTNKGNPGHGGTSTLGTVVTQIEKKDGNKTDNGKVKITMQSK